MSTMPNVEVRLDSELASLLNDPNRKLEDVLREYIVVEAYRRREISGGRASELLGMRLSDFMAYAGRLGIPYIDMTEAEWHEEVKTALEK
jgi:predicted HTH domain antitoxin